jgi:hypothetical protein
LESWRLTIDGESGCWLSGMVPCILILDDTLD